MLVAYGHKKKVCNVGGMTHIPPPPSRAGMGSTSGRSESEKPTFGARFLRFFEHFGPCRWVLGVRPAGRRGGVRWRKKSNSHHASTCAVAAPPLATSSGALAELAE